MNCSKAEIADELLKTIKDIPENEVRAWVWFAPLATLQKSLPEITSRLRADWEQYVPR